MDDPRNTDNAWMETKAINFHDEEGTSLGNFNLEAGKFHVHIQLDAYFPLSRSPNISIG